MQPCRLVLVLLSSDILATSIGIVPVGSYSLMR